MSNFYRRGLCYTATVVFIPNITSSLALAQCNNGNHPIIVNIVGVLFKSLAKGCIAGLVWPVTTSILLRSIWKSDYSTFDAIFTGSRIGE